MDGKEPPPVFVAGLPPVEMADDSGEGDFAAQHGLFAYPDHRPHAAGAEDRSAWPPAASCLQARVVHFEGGIRGALLRQDSLSTAPLSTVHQST